MGGKSGGSTQRSNMSARAARANYRNRRASTGLPAGGGFVRAPRAANLRRIRTNAMGNARRSRAGGSIIRRTR